MTEQCLTMAKRVRGLYGGKPVVDSRQALMLRGDGRIPVYYFPPEDVAVEHLRESSYTTHCPSRGEARYWHLRVGDRRADNAAWSYPEAGGGYETIRGYIAFDWDALDGWFEEDEPVHVHPRDPRVRLDILASSSTVRFELGGVAVAESHSPVFLHETGLPPRWYLPPLAWRRDLLVPSETVTRCPYKGEARYFHLELDGERYEDLIWYYPFPTREAEPVAGRLACYQERLDRVLVDGELQRLR